VDFNHDGLEDVVSGSYHPGDLYVFIKQPDGTYAAGEKIMGRDEEPVNAGPAAACYLVDWDGDGDLDIVVGNISGEVFLFINEGTRGEPAYGRKQPLAAAGRHINVGHDAGPIVVDWDGDGRQDLIVGGGDGEVLFYRNTSEDEATPELAAAQTLVPKSGVMGRADVDGRISSLKHGMRVKPHVTDWNGDGKLDLLIGDFNSVTVEEPQVDAQREKREQAAQKMSELTERQQSLSVPPDGETMEQRRERQKELRNVQREIIEHAREAMAAQPNRRETHGYVWLLLRQ
jgi:hypothetical protein